VHLDRAREDEARHAGVHRRAGEPLRRVDVGAAHLRIGRSPGGKAVRAPGEMHDRIRPGERRNELVVRGGYEVERDRPYRPSGRARVRAPGGADETTRAGDRDGAASIAGCSPNRRIARRSVAGHTHFQPCLR
jgi:hypothetical protein